MTAMATIETTNPRASAQPTGDDGTTYTFGMPVSCRDGDCGELGGIVIDQARGAISHLVVEPHRRHALGRLVPIELTLVDQQAIVLRIGLDRLRELPCVQESVFLPGDPWMAAQLSGDTFAAPFSAQAPAAILRECLPPGETELRRGEPLHASDGPRGRLRALVASPEHRVTQVLLREGHLWTVKDVAVPVGTGDRFDDDGLHVSVTKRDLAGLTALDHGPRVGA
jgi:hypothetical protein